ncbi:hypothetical protein Bca4012_019562 [Brassica carinata]
MARNSLGETLPKSYQRIRKKETSGLKIQALCVGDCLIQWDSGRGKIRQDDGDQTEG